MKWVAIAIMPLALLAGIALASFLLIRAYGAEINSAGMEVPSQEQILACGADARRLCPTLIRGPYDQLNDCMRANKRKLSPRCQESFK